MTNLYLMLISLCHLYPGCTSGSTNVEGSLKDIKDQGTQSKSDQTRLIKKDDPSYFNPRSRLDTDQSVFKVYKGVKTFAFAKSKNVIVTGGWSLVFVSDYFSLHVIFLVDLTTLY